MPNRGGVVAPRHFELLSVMSDIEGAGEIPEPDLYARMAGMTSIDLALFGNRLLCRSGLCGKSALTVECKQPTPHDDARTNQGELIRYFPEDKIAKKQRPY